MSLSFWGTSMANDLHRTLPDVKLNTELSSPVNIHDSLLWRAWKEQTGICKQELLPHLHLILPLESCQRERKTCDFSVFSELCEPNQQTFLVGPLFYRVCLILKSICPTYTRVTGFFFFFIKRKPTQSWMGRKEV